MTNQFCCSGEAGLTTSKAGDEGIGPTERTFGVVFGWRCQSSTSQRPGIDMDFQ